MQIDPWTAVFTGSLRLEAEGREGDGGFDCGTMLAARGFGSGLVTRFPGFRAHRNLPR